MDPPVVDVESPCNRRNKQPEMTSWIAISSLIIFAVGIGLEGERFMIQPSPETLERPPPLQEYIPAEVFDIVCMSVTIVWMSVVLGLHFWKQWGSPQRKADVQDHRKPHIGSYLIYGLFFFVLGGTFRDIFRLMLFFKSDTEGIGRAYHLIAIVYINLQAFFIHCNRKEILFKRHLLNGIVIFHTVVTNATLYVRVFVESRRDNTDLSNITTSCNCTKQKYPIPAYSPTTEVTQRALDYEKMYEESSVFLSPFMLEFALTAIAMLAELWSGHDEDQNSEAKAGEVTSTKYGTMQLTGREHDSSQLSTTEKIKKAAGAVVLGLTVFGSFIFLVIMLCYLGEQSNPNMVFQLYKFASYLIMVVICVIGHLVLQCYPKRKLKGARLDEVLIYISVLGPISMAVLHFIAAMRKIKSNEKTDTEMGVFALLYLFESVVSIFQSILQSTLITKALHREPRTLTGCLKVFNPCNLAILLAAFNLGLWLLATIGLESVGSHHFYTDYMLEKATKIDNDCFGSTHWRAIRVFIFPIIVFYRIHSFFTLFRVFDIHSHIILKTTNQG